MQIRDIGVLAAVIIDCCDANHPSSTLVIKFFNYY